jgi:hypothetical protein
MKKSTTRFSLLLLLCALNFYSLKAQTFTCNGDLLFTRQYAPSPNSYLSLIDFSTGDINITNPGTLTPAANVNASVWYGGYVWAQNWSQSTTDNNFRLARVNSAYGVTNFAVANNSTGQNMPADATLFNNAGVSKTGIMYILAGGSYTLHAIDVSGATPVYANGYPKTVTGIAGANADVIWGDIAVDPITDRVYCWYHPTAVGSVNQGLYEITNINTASPTFVKVGPTVALTIGTLFFNDRGQLFAYGSDVLAGTQNRFYAVDKNGGSVTQYGLPDLAVSQSDGSSCPFRISLDRAVSTPLLNIPKCAIDTFSYTFSPLNFSTTTATNVTFSDTLDSRLSYVTTTATLQTQLQALYGAGVVVTIGSANGGSNNVVNATGLNIAVGSASFTLRVRIDAGKFSTSATISQGAWLKGIANIIGGPNEPSNNPTTFNSKDKTPIVINLSGDRCLPPTANNFNNLPMPQGNGATAIPPLTGSDADGVVTQFNITALPLNTEGVISVACPATFLGATCDVNGYQILTAAVLSNYPTGIPLTPAQNATLRFDPAANFTGTANLKFSVTDNSGNTSNVANYNLPVNSLPPVSNNLMENNMLNTNGPTAIRPLSSADADGSISSYQITTLPLASQGVLSVPCPPNITGATVCDMSGYQQLNATTLSNNSNAIPLTAAQMAAMRFDPAAGFIGNATFNYNATDNSGNISNTANYTIPVVGVASNNVPPLAENVQAQPIKNSEGNTAIPPLNGSDLDGTVVKYTIATIPPVASGVLRLQCPTTPVNLTCTGGFADVLPNTELTIAEVSKLVFDPAPTFIGTANFTYTAADNTGKISNTANYQLPIINTPPTAINVNTQVPFNSPALPIPVLGGSDKDGTVTSFTITTLPTAAQGTISVPCTTNIFGQTCTGGFVNLTPAFLASNPAGFNLTPAQANAIRFTPATGFSGNLSFTYNTTDNNNQNSTQATYRITVPNQPPTTSDINNTVMPNTNGATAINNLVGTDPDGTISSYTLVSVPSTSNGTLSVACPPNITGATCVGGRQNLTETVLAANPLGIVLTPAQAASLQFDPAPSFTGIAGFSYQATDNSGNLSNISNYNIPVSGVGNLPPIANNISVAAMPSTNDTTAITSLSGVDPDGTIATFNVTTLPPATQGVLSVAGCTPALLGATCVNNRQSLTAAVLANYPNGITLTPAQASALKFDPQVTFTGIVTFGYTVTDNFGLISNNAVYNIPVTSNPPISYPIVAAPITSTSDTTAIPAFISTDIDGTIAGYFVEVVPPTSQGVLSVTGCTPALLGATCINNRQSLTAAVLANYPNGGIPLTPAQINGLKFDPTSGYNGDVIFNYHSVDNSGAVSNSSTYTIPVTGVPPVSKNVLSGKLVNTLDASPISALNSGDADGTIAEYRITSIPPASQGVISIPCGPTPIGASCAGGFANLTAAVLAANPGGIVLNSTQASGMRFDPAAGFVGDVIFNYVAFDNNGNISNTAVYTIPVGTFAALATNLITFNAQKISSNILVNWQVANPATNTSYEVEYSTNGNSFAISNSATFANNLKTTYTHTINNATLPLYYIRLKTTNANGSVTYSNIVVIKNTPINAVKIAVAPNPASTTSVITLTTIATTKTQINIIDVKGRVLQSLEVTLQPGVNNVYLKNLGSLPNGIYVVTTIVNSEKLTQKLVISR